MLTIKPFSNTPQRFWLIFCIFSMRYKTYLASQQEEIDKSSKTFLLHCLPPLICHWKGYKMVSHPQTLSVRLWLKSGLQCARAILVSAFWASNLCCFVSIACISSPITPPGTRWWSMLCSVIPNADCACFLDGRSSPNWKLQVLACAFPLLLRRNNILPLVYCAESGPITANFPVALPGLAGEYDKLTFCWVS